MPNRERKHQDERNTENRAEWEPRDYDRARRRLNEWERSGYDRDRPGSARGGHDHKWEQPDYGKPQLFKTWDHPDYQRQWRNYRKPHLDYGWERLYEGQGYDWEERPAYGWERPGFKWQRGASGYGRPNYGWGRPGDWEEREDFYRDGPYVGRGPKGYGRSDEFIREDVCERLTQDPWIDASEIEVEVRDGVVTLKGTVDSRQTKRTAEEVIDSVAGIKDVANQLRVRQHK